MSRGAWWKPPVRSSSGIALDAVADFEGRRTGSREVAKTRRARAAESRVAKERGPRAGAASGDTAGGMRGRVCGRDHLPLGKKKDARKWQAGSGGKSPVMLVPNVCAFSLNNPDYPASGTCPVGTLDARESSSREGSTQSPSRRPPGSTRTSTQTKPFPRLHQHEYARRSIHRDARDGPRHPRA